LKNPEALIGYNIGQESFEYLVERGSLSGKENLYKKHPRTLQYRKSLVNPKN
jgi:hypothetical protein